MFFCVNSFFDSDDDEEAEAEAEADDDDYSTSGRRSGRSSGPPSNVMLSSDDVGSGERKKILITGANGNIGSKLLQFWRNKYELILVDIAEPSEMVNYCLLHCTQQHSYVRLNLKYDTQSLKKLMQQCHVVVHLAASVCYIVYIVTKKDAFSFGFGFGFGFGLILQVALSLSV